VLPAGEFSVIAACSSNMFYQRESDKILLLIRSRAAGAALCSITISCRQCFSKTIWSQNYSFMPYFSCFAAKGKNSSRNISLVSQNHRML